jgi:hypothetical protein
MIVSQTLWKLPVPATALIKEPTFTILPKRTCALSFLIEGEETAGEIEASFNFVEISLVFEGVESFKCTYRSSATVEMIHLAYGKLVDLEQSEWLTAILTIQKQNKHLPLQDLRHLMIYFDDGPCYEIICSKFTESRRKTLKA